jgi:hypothetical protein
VLWPRVLYTKLFVLAITWQILILYISVMAVGRNCFPVWKYFHVVRIPRLCHLSNSPFYFTPKKTDACNQLSCRFHIHEMSFWQWHCTTARLAPFITAWQRISVWQTVGLVCVPLIWLHTGWMFGRGRTLYNQNICITCMVRTTTVYFHTEHYIRYTTTCFGSIYWPSSGCTVNLTSSYTIYAWGTVGGTRSGLTLVGGMVLDHYGPVSLFRNRLIQSY